MTIDRHKLGHVPEHPLDFGITTGDNFYPTAFPTPTDPNWQVTWANLYEPLGIPFYISLGNHDWYEPTGEGPLAEYVRQDQRELQAAGVLLHVYGGTRAALCGQYHGADGAPARVATRGAIERAKPSGSSCTAIFPVYEQTGYSVEAGQEKLLPILEEFEVDAYFADTTTRCSTGSSTERTTW